MHVQLPDPDEFEPAIVHHTCAFHKLNPGAPWAGCTCSTSFSQKRRPAEEVAKIKADRRRVEEDKILAQADLIRAQRKIMQSD